MGRGIAVVFAYAGHPVKVVDFKARSEDDFKKLEAECVRRNPRRAREPRVPSACSTLRRSTPSSRASASCASRMRKRLLVRRRDLRRRAGSAGPQARSAGARLRTRRALADHRIDHIDHSGRRHLQRGRASGALPQRALAEPGLSGAAGRNVAGQAHRSGRHRAAEGDAGRHRQGAGRLRRAARLHRAAHPVAGDERSRAHGGGRRRQRRRHRQGDQIRLRLPLRRARRCWNSSTGAVATFCSMPAAI